MQFDIGKARETALIGVAFGRFAGNSKLHKRIISRVFAEVATTSTLTLFKSDHVGLLVVLNGC